MTHSRLLVPIFLTVVAAAVGCQESSDAAKRRATRPAKPGPEESFELIVETFRRGIEDVPVGFVSRSAEGHSLMTGRSEVSHTLIRPEKEGDPYKAIITVGSQSRYSIQRSTTEEEPSEEQQQNNPLDEDVNSDFQILDRDLVRPSGATKQDRRSQAPANENVDTRVTKQVDRQERKYELLYENGKWKLLTKLDPETEQSVQNAFKRALEMQI